MIFEGFREREMRRRRKNIKKWVYKIREISPKSAAGEKTGYFGVGLEKKHWIFWDLGEVWGNQGGSVQSWPPKAAEKNHQWA